MILALGLIRWTGPAQSAENSNLHGKWNYTGFIYEGQRHPKPNPNLILHFTFQADQTVRLYWTRKDETGFCERKADFHLQNSMLWQKITWVNPSNDSRCGQDTDMQMGRESETPIQLNQNELYFVLEVSGKPFLYVLEREDSAL